MPKIEVSMLIFALSIWGQASMSTVAAQAVPAITSADTVEALLQAENKSILQRVNATSPQSAAQATANAQTAPVNKEVALLSVYGVSSDLRVDVKYGDFIYAGLAPGQRVGPLQVVSIDGICAHLLMLQEAQRPVQQCWSLALANRQPPSPSKPESVQNTPLPSGMNLPPLPGFSGFSGLPRGVSPGASLPVMSQ